MSIRGESDALLEKAPLLDAFSIESATAVVIGCGVGTVVTALIGFFGAWKDIDDLLKLYVFILFLVCGVQLAIGIYLSDLDWDYLRELWFQDDGEGYDRRDRLQRALDCCGWDTLTDSYSLPAGGYGPDCHDVTIRETCSTAIESELDKYINPVAVVSLVFGTIELLLLLCACYNVMVKPSQHYNVEDDAYSY